MIKRNALRRDRLSRVLRFALALIFSICGKILGVEVIDRGISYLFLNAEGRQSKYMAINHKNIKKSRSIDLSLVVTH